MPKMSSIHSAVLTQYWYQPTMDRWMQGDLATGMNVSHCHPACNKVKLQQLPMDHLYRPQDLA